MRIATVQSEIRMNWVSHDLVKIFVQAVFEFRCVASRSMDRKNRATCIMGMVTYMPEDRNEFKTLEG